MKDASQNWLQKIIAGIVWICSPEELDFKDDGRSTLQRRASSIRSLLAVEKLDSVEEPPRAEKKTSLIRFLLAPEQLDQVEPDEKPRVSLLKLIFGHETLAAPPEDDGGPSDVS